MYQFSRINFKKCGNYGHSIKFVQEVYDNFFTPLHSGAKSGKMYTKILSREQVHYTGAKKLSYTSLTNLIKDP